VASVYGVHAKAPDGGTAGPIHIAGPEPFRILIIGNGPNSGLGVLSHELGLAGQLGRGIAAATARGVDVESITRIRLFARTAEELLAEVDLRRFDAIVLTLGYTESIRLASVRRWGRELASLLDSISARSAPCCQVFCIAARPLVPHPEFREAFTRPANAHMTLVNRTAREVARGRPFVSYLELRPRVSVSFFQHNAQAYERWAEAMTPRIVPLLTSAGATKPVTDESRRQAAVEELGILDTPREDRFDQYTRLAVDLLGITGAAITFIDNDRQWIKSSTGFAAPQSTPRADAFCDITIRSPEMLVVEDTRADPRFANLPGARGRDGQRFYAGYPIEGRDGQRIGAFCVVDTRPRSFSRADRVLLRDLALKVQADLWEHADAT
jgi:hypothetical protein